MDKHKPKTTWQEFEGLVEKILTANGFTLTKNDIRGDRGFDFFGQKDNESWAIEVKHYRTDRAQPRLIESAATRVVRNGSNSDVSKGMLVVSCLLPRDLRQILERKFGIGFIDRADLMRLGAVQPELIDELQALTENASSFPNGEEDTSPLLTSGPLNRAPALALDTKGSDLSQRLQSTPQGKKAWKAYEDLCEEILRYLFPHDLHGWEKQQRTDDGLNRFDLICRLRPTTDYWRFLIDHLNSRYILFEFKNYSTYITQGQILTTEKYLLEKALRKVAVILTRLGWDKGAYSMVQGAMREHGKLMLIINDAVLIEMLEMKQRGEDPTDRLFELTDQFLLSLPR
jgi:hypothetical protein